MENSMTHKTIFSPYSMTMQSQKSRPSIMSQEYTQQRKQGLEYIRSLPTITEQVSNLMPPNKLKIKTQSKKHRIKIGLKS